jgi:TRAP-type C4-dicarboxylate transport system substrate-binding protein
MQLLRALSIASMAALLVPTTAPGWAQDKPVHLKIAHWVPPSHPMHKAMEDWGASIQKDTNGTVTFTVFPSQQLGKAFDHYDMVRDGIADVAFVNGGYQPGRFPILDGANLLFMMSKGGAGSQAADAWYRKYAPAEMKDVKYCFNFVHDFGSFHSRKKVVVPGDVKGLKVRPADAAVASLVTTLGGTNVQASAPEIRDVLEKGVADAATSPWGSVMLFGIDKVTKYHMKAPLYVNVLTWIMNKNVYQGMSPAQQKVVDEHCSTDWALRAAGPWADFERAGVAKLEAMPGHEVYALTPEQLDEWRKAAEPVVKIWADAVRKVGVDPDVALAELKASVAKYNALE